MDIAITGHRPKDLATHGIGPRQVAELTREGIKRAEKRAGLGEPITFHTGGALGVDTWVAQEVQRSDRPGIHHMLHLPFDIDVMSKFWTEQQNAIARSVTAHADRICMDCTSQTFDYTQYQRRNECMVQHSTYVLAFWTGKRGGGTFNCIQYALEHGYRVYNALDEFRPINPRDFR